MENRSVSIPSIGVRVDTLYTYDYDPVSDSTVRSELTTQNDETAITRTIGLTNVGGLINGVDRTVPNPWSYVKYDIQTGLGRLYQRETDSDGRLTRVLSGPQAYNGPDLGVTIEVPDNNIVNDAIADMYKKLRGELDLSIAAFQAKQTAALFSPTQQVLQFARKASLAKNVGKAWLQYRYGWQPLLSDISAVIDESLRGVTAQTQKIKVRKQKTYTENRNRNTFDEANRVREVTVEEKSVQYKVQVGCSFSLPGGNTTDRWTSLNPVSIGWELLPYSFVADWFYDVGSYLRSAETSVLYSDQFINGYISTLEIRKDKYRWVQTTDTPTLSRDLQNNREDSVVSFSRNILNSTPFPRPPQLNYDLGSGKLLNAAALLSQFLGRGK